MILTTKGIFFFSSTQLDKYPCITNWWCLFFYLVNKHVIFSSFPFVTILFTYSHSKAISKSCPLDFLLKLCYHPLSLRITIAGCHSLTSAHQLSKAPCWFEDTIYVYQLSLKTPLYFDCNLHTSPAPHTMLSPCIITVYGTKSKSLLTAHMEFKRQFLSWKRSIHYFLILPCIHTLSSTLIISCISLKTVLTPNY